MRPMVKMLLPTSSCEPVQEAGCWKGTVDCLLCIDTMHWGLWELIKNCYASRLSALVCVCKCCGNLQFAVARFEARYPFEPFYWPYCVCPDPISLLELIVQWLPSWFYSAECSHWPLERAPSLTDIYVLQTCLGDLCKLRGMPNASALFLFRSLQTSFKLGTPIVGRVSPYPQKPSIVSARTNRTT